MAQLAITQSLTSPDFTLDRSRGREASQEYMGAHLLLVAPWGMKEEHKPRISRLRSDVKW